MTTNDQAGSRRDVDRAEYIRRLVDAAPPLRADQAELLRAALVRPAAQRRPAA